ncbi:MAG: 23S rRNA (uracil(1939)-C(5))-methyltransferase RlmD [Salibacteraceae bacterium]
MKKRSTVNAVEIIDLGAKGKVIGKKDGEVFLTTNAVPGDVVSIEVRRKKKGLKEGVVTEFETISPDRVEAVCKHFSNCGGCNWQNLDYAKQIEHKERNVLQQIRRIAGISDFQAEPILGAEHIYNYRNKLEFTFVSERWLTPEEIRSEEEIVKGPALGFHVPGRFDWVLHVDQCHLQNDEHNAIRNFIYEEAVKLSISFYHPRKQSGTMRNLVLRNNRAGEWMVLLIVKEKSEAVRNLSKLILSAFPKIQSFWLIENQKVNDSYSDCPSELISGKKHIIESFARPASGEHVHFLIGPKSFFQTNPYQAERLYQTVYQWSDIQPEDVVYDLYTGTGSIALFVADRAKKLVGIEYVPEAISDANENAALNNIKNCSFFAGDMKDILTAEFISEHGKPDVLITDPPRAGMHADVVERILQAEPKRIVYVSCDPATQARDLAMLKSKYKLVKTQAVDMFPHTSHAENIALLALI